MTAATFSTTRRIVPLRFVIMMAAIIPLSVLIGRLVFTSHAEDRHGGEQYPPKVIRACVGAAILDRTVFRYESADGSRIALICRLAENRYGIQLLASIGEGRDIVVKEITTFYSTLSRARNILDRDGYIALSAPLP